LVFSTGEPVKRTKFDIDGGVARVLAKGETIALPVGPIDLTPPKDPKIMSLFITGVEDGREFTMMFDKANFFLMDHEYDEAPRDCRKLGNDEIT
jgi:hypothetical protein